MKGKRRMRASLRRLPHSEERYVVSVVGRGRRWKSRHRDIKWVGKYQRRKGAWVTTLAQVVKKPPLISIWRREEERG